MARPGPARTSQFPGGVDAAKRIEIVPEAASPRAGEGAPFAGTSALSSDPAAVETLRFRIRAEQEALDALRHARRSMLREEWTLGRAEGQPSLEDAMFSPEGIVWPVRRDQHPLCFEKIRELEARVERTLAELTRA